MRNSKRDTISAREREIIELACKGLTDKEICRTLSLSLTTVRTYWGRAREKLGAVNRAQVVAEVSARHLAETLAGSGATRMAQAKIGTWVYWPDQDLIVLDCFAGQLLGGDDLVHIGTPKQLLAKVATPDRAALEDLLRCPRASMTRPGVLHRAAALNGAAPKVRTVVMGPCHDAIKGKGWVLVSMVMEDAVVGTDARFAVI